MLDARPKEKEWFSWLWAVSWAIVILLTIPLARMISDRIAELVGRQAFVWLTASAIAIGMLLGLRSIARRTLPPSAYVALAVFGGGLLWMAWTLRGNPVEAFHLVQYGILSVLFYRALLHRMNDYGIYVIAALLTAAVGILDEWIQWLIPGRFWGMRDVLINLAAAVLTQSAIGAGLRPGVIRGKPTAKSVRRVCYGLALLLGMLCVSYANTPDRIAWYARLVPGAGYLLDSQSMMVEYGYRYEDPEIGVFRSRFNRDSLRRLDQQRGAEVAVILDKFRDDGDWRRFRNVYTVPRDAYAHEIGTHLFRRNRHLDLARDETRTTWQRLDSYLIAQRENRILEKYFPHSLNKSIHRWGDATRVEVDTGADRRDHYESWVSVELITSVSRQQALTIFAVIISLVIVIGIIAGQRGRRSDKPESRTESR